MFTAKVDVNELESNLRDARDRFRHCCVYFAVAQTTDMQPKDFLLFWVGFCDDFKTAWKREHQRLVKLR